MATFTGRFWTDVFGYGSLLGAAYVVDDGPDPQAWKTVKVEVEGIVIKTTVAPQAPDWLRIAAKPNGDYLIVAQGSGLLIYDSVLDTWVTNGLCFGQRPVGIGWNGSNFVIACQSSGTTYRRIVYGVSDTVLAIPIGLTSQGMLQYFPGATSTSDVIRWTDPNRTISVDGRTLYLASIAGGVTLGQWDGAGSLAVLANGDVALAGDVAEDPRIASVGDRWVTGSWGLNGVTFVTYSPPWPGLTPNSPPDTGGSGTGLSGGGGIVAPTVATNSGLARSIERKLPRLYHETDQIPDAHTQRMGRLLWDRTYDLSDQMLAVDAHVGDFSSRIAALEVAHAETRKIAESAGVAAGKAVSTASSGIAVGQPTIPGPTGPTIPPTPPPGTPPGTPPPPAPNVGDFMSGITTAGPTGHVTAGQPITYSLAGQIVGGTAREWSALLAPAVDAPTRQANLNELWARMFWHLNLAGVTCATNLYEPFGPGSLQSMVGAIWFNIAGVELAYSIFDFNGQYVDYTAPLLVAPAGIGPQMGYPAGGTPD